MLLTCESPASESRELLCRSREAGRLGGWEFDSRLYDSRLGGHRGMKLKDYEGWTGLNYFALTGLNYVVGEIPGALPRAIVHRPYRP